MPGKGAVVVANINILFRPLCENDLFQLFVWLQLSHIKKWWDCPNTYEAMFEKYVSKINSPFERCYIIEENEKPFGFIQQYDAENFPDSRWPDQGILTSGIDFLIGESSYLRKGYGATCIKQFSNWLFDKKIATRIVADPSKKNKAATYALLQAGFIHIASAIDKSLILMELKKL